MEKLTTESKNKMSATAESFGARGGGKRSHPLSITLKPKDTINFQLTAKSINLRPRLIL